MKKRRQKENGVPVYGSGERPKIGPSVTFATQVQRTGDVSAPSSRPPPPTAPLVLVLFVCFDVTRTDSVRRGARFCFRSMFNWWRRDYVIYYSVDLRSNRDYRRLIDDCGADVTKLSVSCGVV